MLGCFLATVVPAKIVVAVCEVNIFLVEDGGPLEWRSCVSLINIFIMSNIFSQPQTGIR
jgi:hypothetical protein